MASDTYSTEQLSRLKAILGKANGIKFLLIDFRSRILVEQNRKRAMAEQMG
jgi:hypothetical protein